MSKKIIPLLPYFALLFSANLAQAGLMINEIMYDLAGSDTGREWIEIHNDADVSVDISSFKFFEADTNHGLILAEGNANIGAKGYAIISSDAAKFKIDWPNFVGTIFDSSFSLDNDGEALALKDANLNITDQYTYSSSSGADGDGKSLQKKSGSWTSATPTPGMINETTNQTAVTTPAPSSNNSGSASSSSQTIASTKTAPAEIPKIKTKITAEKIAFAGTPVLFSANTTGYSNEPLFYGKYFWNFGDGDSKEIKVSDATKFTHTFSYEGEYVVALEYRANDYSENPDAFDEKTIKVIKADISISQVGDGKDFFIEISNDTSYDTDLSEWTIKSIQKNFIFPKNTILSSKKKMILSPKITGFSVLDKNTLKLINREGETVFDYFNYLSSVKTVPVLTKKAVPEKMSEVKPKAKPAEEEKAEPTVVEIPVENLLAQSAKTNINKESNFKYGVLGLIVFLGIGGYGAYFIRTYNRKFISEATPGNDFEIIDE